MSALQDLVSILQVTPVAPGRFRGQPGPGAVRIYGGLILTQAIDAARQCCPAQFVLQSLHGQFLRPGNYEHRIDIGVQVLKEGRRFRIYNVECAQAGQTIFFATVSFHLPEQAYEHSLSPPELVVPDAKTALFLPHRQVEYRAADTPGTMALEVRMAVEQDQRRSLPPQNITWFRLADQASLSDWQHTLLLAYVSDWNLPSVAIRPHIIPDGFEPALASLDHAIWFYHQARLDDWIAYVQDSPVAMHGRGHSRGLIYDLRGNLLASACQESYLALAKSDSSGARQPL